MILKCFIVLLITSYTLSSVANQTPRGLMTDSRIKIVSYDEDEVVQVRTTFGYATTIELQKGEYITDKPGTGKAEGWYVVSENFSNLISIKPKKANNTTNLNFSTNKGRSYTFLLSAEEESKHPTFRIRFEYEDSHHLSSPQKAYQLISHFDNPTEVNANYSFWGDKTIAPIVAKDNGNFTLLRFKPGAPIPAILAVDLKTRRESLVNYRLQSGYVVVEGVYPQYTFRLGEHVTCLFNETAIKEWKNGI